MAARSRRNQRPVKGGRERAYAGVLRDVARHVEQDARRFNVSRSFVIAVALAEHYRVKVESYMEPVRRKSHLRRVI
jgi:hypothetical protein